MTNPLVQYALSNIWCTPEQDNQVIFKLARLTGYNGVMNSWKVFMTSFKLPEQNVRFHLFQIGQIHPKLINLFPQQNAWVKISDSCNQTDTNCHLYADSGVRFALTQCYYLVTEEGNVIIAIKELRQLGKLTANSPELAYGKANVYINLYNNAYFASNRSLGVQDQVGVFGGVAGTTQQIIDWQVDYNAKKLLPGHVIAYRNGLVVRNVSLTTCAVGDLIEYVYDSSVRRIVDFPLANLQTFDSQLDQTGKYILHHNLPNVDTIDYLDDIDFFLVDTTTERGVYFHKNNARALRMLTHRDYSVAVSQIEAYLNEHASWLSFANAKLQALVRYSGYERPLVNEHSRIKELYKLPDEKILQAMTGINSTVPVWKAEALEQSQYARLMSSIWTAVNASTVSAALGYNAVAKQFADPFVRTTGTTTKQAQVPYLYQIQSVGFEYDAQGKLLGYKNHAGAVTYTCNSAQAVMVEFVRGVGGIRVDDVYDEPTQTLQAGLDYRFYISPKYGNAQQAVWTDVTEDQSKYYRSGDTLHWLISTEYRTLVRSNAKFLLDTKTFNLSEGLLSFNITSERLVNGNPVQQNLEVPLGELDIYLNGKALIQDLDYQLKFPMVVIRNKEYLDQQVNTQQVVLRNKGLCRTDQTQSDCREYGFVVNGRLSVDRQFDIRDDKCQRLQLNGGVYMRDQVIFNEDTATFEFSSLLNGRPYLVKDAVVPMRDLVGRDTLIYRDASVVVDGQVRDYLTLFKPTPNPETLNPIQAQYSLFSPFLCKIIADLKTGVINDPILQQQYNDNTVMALCANYQYLLEIDPIHPDLMPSADYVNVHPHCWNTMVDLSAHQYTFVNRVIRLYARNTVTLSGFARIV